MRLGGEGEEVRVVEARAEADQRRRKVEEVLAMACAELGAESGMANLEGEARAYLAVRARRVVGCVVAEPVEEAFEIAEEGRGGVACSETARPALLGVSLVWVHATARRRGLASAMVDAARAAFFYGRPVPPASLAFSQPTLNGLAFARAYSAARRAAGAEGSDARGPLIYRPAA